MLIMGELSAHFRPYVVLKGSVATLHIDEVKEAILEPTMAMYLYNIFGESRSTECRNCFSFILNIFMYHRAKNTKALSSKNL